MAPDLKQKYPGEIANVFLANGFEVLEGPVGAAIRFQNVLELEAALGLAVLHKPGRLNGSEILFLRHKADWRQEDVAALLHVSTQSVSLWERGEVRIQPSADLLFRARFVAESKVKWRPRIAARVLWRTLDRLVKEVADFNYIGHFSNAWKFTYEKCATTFFAYVSGHAEPAGIGGRFGAFIERERWTKLEELLASQYSYSTRFSLAKKIANVVAEPTATFLKHRFVLKKATDHAGVRLLHFRSPKLLGKPSVQGHKRAVATMKIKLNS